MALVGVTGMGMAATAGAAPLPSAPAPTAATHPPAAPALQLAMAVPATPTKSTSQAATGSATGSATGTAVEPGKLPALPEPPMPTSEGAKKAVYPKKVEEMEKAAKADPLEFLRTSLKWTDDTVLEYTCQFKKIENIGGTLHKPETMLLKFRAAPFAVYIKWVQEPSKGQEAIYAEGTNNGKAAVHPAGVVGVMFRRVDVAPDSKDALKHSRRPVTNAGMANMIRIIIPQCEEAQKAGDLKLTYEGLRNEGGRPAYVFKRVLPKPAPGKPEYACDVLLIYIDQQYLTCIRTDAFDWGGELISHYSYYDLNINPGLDEKEFDTNNADYGFRLF
jgi:hypothetical protein